MGKKRRGGKAAKRGDSASSNAEARNSDGCGLQPAATGPAASVERGEIANANGTYEGDIKDDKPHGNGVGRFASGEIYEGEFKDGQTDGRGVCRYDADGDVYDGEWKDDAHHGRGTYTFSTGKVYEGQWVRGKQHGKGKMKSASGRIYEGLWMNGLRVCNQGRTMRSELSQQRRLQVATKNCEHCGVNEGQYKLRVCSGCNLALYCSTACQKAASRSHRRICDMVSILPSRDSDKITLEYDLDAGLRYATKYMDNLKHVKINLKKMKRGHRAPNFTAERLSSLLKSKKEKLDSVLWLSNEYISDPPASRWMWMELQALKQLWIEHAIFDEFNPFTILSFSNGIL